VPFALYARGVGPLPPAAPVREIDAIVNARPPRLAPPPPPAPGFRLAGVRRGATWELIRYLAPAPVPVPPPGAFALTLRRREPAAYLIQRPG
jgi:hypothetical protein